MSFYTPKNECFWNFRHEPEKCSIKEKAEIEHTYAALRIVAESQGKDINESFKELYKECCYLRILLNWSQFKPLTEEEKAEEEKRMREEEEFWKSELGNEDYPSWFIEDEEDEEYYIRVYRFVEIMSTDYKQITEEMKKEALNLFPSVFESLGNFGQYVSCDGKKVL